MSNWQMAMDSKSRGMKIGNFKCNTAVWTWAPRTMQPCTAALFNRAAMAGGGRRLRRFWRRLRTNKNSTARIFTIWFSCPLTNNVTMWHAWPNNFMGGLCGLYGLFWYYTQYSIIRIASENCESFKTPPSGFEELKTVTVGGWKIKKPRKWS